MCVSPVKRRYDSPRRAADAARTRAAILGAARTLFLEHGYTGTTFEAVARAAGVSVPTVKANFANKPNLLSAVRDLALAGDDEPVPVEERDSHLAILEERDPRVKLNAFAQSIADIHERVGPIHRLIRDAAMFDEKMAELWRLEQAQRRQGMASVAWSLQRQGALRTGLSERDATTTLWVLSSPETYWLLTDVDGQSIRYYVRWLQRTMADALCGQ